MEDDPTTPNSPQSISWLSERTLSVSTTSSRTLADPPSPMSTSDIEFTESPYSIESPNLRFHESPNFHPHFLPLLRHLSSQLWPLVNCETGLLHPDFPPNMLAYNLLTSEQVDNLARHFHQVHPPVPATFNYPVYITPWIGTEEEKTIDLPTRVRRLGRFFGLRGCEERREDEDVEMEDEHGNASGDGDGNGNGNGEILLSILYLYHSIQSYITKMSKPLISHIYTADPSAHVFNNKLYIYPSHDRETTIAFNDNGDQYDMADYHVLSMSSITSPVTDHGVVLRDKDIPWVSKQLWAPDAATKNNKFYLFFPARDQKGIFRIGVAVSESPEGPFVPQENYIQGTYSIDPAVFVDEEAGGEAYLYVGGIWGGQLQCWVEGTERDGGDWVDGDEGGVDGRKKRLVFDESLSGPHEPAGEGVPALCPRVALLSDDMFSLASSVKEVVILAPETGLPLLADDHERRFFEAAWVHRYRGLYYFSYSTGDTHFLVYATGTSPWGPFTYRGKILDPVLGWTTHHSIVEFHGKWYLFYHDCELSEGVDHLRSVKVREIVYDDEGAIHLAEEQTPVQ
ncbi:unnamed protein product [Penicillium glandicola]